MSAPPDAAERAAALDLGHHVIAVAPAGSGKTGLLAQRLLAALAEVEAPEQVVAITFTNKAAAEIRARVLGTLARAAAGSAARDAHDARSLAMAQTVLARDAARAPAQRWRLAANPERLRATTIDGLQAQIAAELPLLSGLGGRPGIVDDARSLYEEAILALFAEIEDEAAPEPVRRAAETWLRVHRNRLDRLIEPFADLLGRREQWQHTLADDWDWPAQDARVLGAVHRAAQERFAAALGAADCETLRRIARSGSDHEALRWAAALDRWPEGVDATPQLAALAALLVTGGGTIRKQITAREGFPPKSPLKAELLALLAAHADDEALARAAAAFASLPPLAMPAEQAALRESLRLLLRRLLGHLRSAMGERGETDFVGIAEAARAALRPRVEGGYAYGEALLRRDAQLRHLLVDEMQDTSEAQLELLRALTSGWQAGDGRSLFLVGDPQQSIYAFRKAEVRLFQRLWRERRLGDLALTPLRLCANFRSEPAIVDWFNAAFTAIFPDRDDELAGEVAYAPSSAARAADDGTGAAVRIHAFAASDTANHIDDGADREARAMAALAHGYAAGGGSVAILVRARPHVRRTLAELRRLGVRVACQDVDPLAELPAVRDVLALARALWHPEDRLSWALLLRAPFVGLSWADLVALSAGRDKLPWPQRLALAGEAALSDDGRARVARLAAALAGVQGDALRAGLPERAEALWATLGGPACVDADALGDVRRAFALLRQHAGAAIADPRAFERAVGELYAASGSGSGAVQVMTIHKAKGLEFDHVLLVGAGRRARSEEPPLLHFIDTPHGPLLVPRPPGIWPDDDTKAAASALFDYAHRLHARSRGAEALRLLYVAATRARRTLDLSFCAPDDDHGQPQPAPASFAGLLSGAPALIRAALCRDEAPERAPPAAPAPDGEPPRAPRLPADYALPPEPPAFQPRGNRALRPSEAVLSAAESKRLDADDVYAQLVGTMLHQALAKIADDGLAAWADGGVSRRAAMAAGLRRLGMPEPLVEAGVARVLALLARMLASATGRWLLGPQRWAQAEYALAGWRDGRWLSASLDRCFETDAGELWVVDYKAAARPVAPAALDAYVAEASVRYRPQIALYAGLLAAHRGAARVRAALYFVEADRLVEFDDAAQAKPE